MLKPPMKMSTKAKAKLVEFESVRLKSYLDGAHWAVGVGHNNSAGTPPRVGPTTRLRNRQEALRILDDDIAILCEAPLNRLLGRRPRQHQFDSFCLLLYATGLTTFNRKMKLIELWNLGMESEVFYKMKNAHSKATYAIYPGWRKRDDFQAALFEGSVRV